MSLRVADDAAGSRLDAWLAGALRHLGRNRAKRLILDGRVAVGGRTIVEPKRPVKPGEHVTVALPAPEPAALQPEAIPLAVVYEDSDLIVVDKPAGMVVHPGAGVRSGTLVNALLAHCRGSLSGIGGVTRPGIVHRLDKDTSGLMVVAKSDRAHRGLAAQFADHGRAGPLERAYRAVVWGAPEPTAGVIDAPLARSARDRRKVAVASTGGRRAVTRYRVVERFAKPPVAALVECRLETGRTHQIRVHLASIGHPLVGDRTYGAGFATKAARLAEPVRGLAAGFRRQALHAYLLGFAHPVTGQRLSFTSPLPEDLAALVSAFKSL